MSQERSSNDEIRIVLEQIVTLERTPTFVNLAHVTSAGTTRTSRSRRRSSAIEVPDNGLTRHRTRSMRREIGNDDLIALTKSASRISGHREAYREGRAPEDGHLGFDRLPRPPAAKSGQFSTIREVPSEFNTPYSSRAPSPTRLLTISRPASPVRSDLESASVSEDEDEDIAIAQNYPDIGRIKSWRGAFILACVCGAQLMDNVFMTGVNIAIPAIRDEFHVPESDLQWLISAYSLTFGGFLLLAGVLADRYGRRNIFCAGMLFLSIWTVANGFAQSFVQVAIFRALQGIGAAATVPSSVGIISSYFVARDRTRGLSLFGAAGAVGFCVGLILGGILTSSLGWRYLFDLSVSLTGSIGILGFFILPKDRIKGQEKPKLDLLGAGLSTTGLILLSFVLSSGGVYGWSKAFIIVLLISSIALLGFFVFMEKRVSNPIMPLSLWKLKNFAALWVSGFVMYGGYQTVIYYCTLIAQEVEKLSASQTAIRFLPMGATGFIFSLSMGRAVEVFNVKHLLLVGMLLCCIAPVSATMMTENDVSFWTHVFPTSVLSVAGTTIVYCTITVVLLGSVPNNVKSLCGGMINTAFQIGSGMGLALSTTVVQEVDVKKGHSEMKQYETGLWFVVGLCGVGFLASLFGVKNVGKASKGEDVPMH